MGFLRTATSLLRKFILIGWAMAVVWIYLGNLVNFHQYHIWGKQLIPVACYSTRAKEKDSASFVKNDRCLKAFDTHLQFDFTTPDQQVFNAPHFEVIYSYSSIPDIPFLQQGILAFSLRGPPSA